MEILIDIFGSDEGIGIPISAAIKMRNKISQKLILVGKKQEIETYINNKYKENAKEIYSKIGILDAQDYITNNEEPAWAIRNKRTSSIVVAYDYMKQKTDSVFISAGSTGAIMAGALLKLGRIDGIHRPALITILPTDSDKRVLLLDSGATAQSKDITIFQYAKLGKVYSKFVLGVENPKFALLNIGEEEEKGTPEMKEIYKHFKENDTDFIGNIEARYILNSKADIVVCDGLIGNIALKSIEGTASLFKKTLSDSLRKNLYTKIVGLLVKPILAAALKKYDYKRNGGGVLLGVNKPVIKVHGSSSVVTFEQAILQAKNMLENNIIEKIKEAII